jgi:hypothetical protein
MTGQLEYAGLSDEDRAKLAIAPTSGPSGYRHRADGALEAIDDDGFGDDLMHAELDRDVRAAIAAVEYPAIDIVPIAVVDHEKSAAPDTTKAPDPSR